MVEPLTIDRPPPQLFMKWFWDIVYMPTGYLFRGIDALSRWPEGKGFQSRKAKGLVSFIVKEVIPRYGCMMECVIDGGEMDAKVMYDEMDRMGVKFVRVISAYNPKANLEERPHQQFNLALAKACQGNTSRWQEMLPTAFWAERVTLNSVTRMSSYELVFGQRAVFPVEFAIETYDVVRWKYPMKPEELLAARIRQLERRELDIERARRRTIEAREKGKVRWEKDRSNVRKDRLGVGEIVLVLDGATMGSLKKKFVEKWYGPYRISKVLDGGTYEVEELDGTTYTKPMHGDRLIIYRGRDGGEPATTRLPLAESEDTTVSTLFFDDDPNKDYVRSWATRIATYHELSGEKLDQFGADYGISDVRTWAGEVAKGIRKRRVKGRRATDLGEDVLDQTGAAAEKRNKRQSARLLDQERKKERERGKDNGMIEGEE
jgi:hypothetical protein